jgi:TRAP-type C4-dicarboxylate transport system substrate-binding protein
MSNAKRHIAVLGVTSAVVALLVACGSGSGVDKAGGKTLVLRLATIDSVNNNGQSYGPQAFVDSLREVSGGAFRVEVTTAWGRGAPEAESDLVEAIAHGRVDAGWPSTRSFANAGISGLEVVEAPMTITSYRAEKALVSGPVADELLDRLDGSGVVGLGLAVGPLRRPFAAEAPLLEPADWEGAAFRVYNSPVQAETVRALGGTPVNVGFSWVEDVQGGRLRGAEFDIPQYARNDLTTEAGNVTANVVLWPKVFVLSFSQKRWDALSEEQRGWVREAADRAVQASVDATYDEATPANDLCESGVRFVDASPEQIRGLRSALQPVLDRLGSDARSGALLKDIQAIAGEHPEPDAPSVPDSCRSGTSVEDPDGVPDETSALPDGVYRVAITPADVEAAGLSNEGGFSGTWTLTVREGTYELRCRPLADPGRDCGNTPAGEIRDDPVEAGELRGRGNTAYFVSSPSLPLPTYHAEWKTDGETVTFSDHTAPGDHLVVSPWRKIR